VQHATGEAKIRLKPDVDLEVDSIEHADSYPLVSKAPAEAAKRPAAKKRAR
jgi:hypothetical protein